MIMIHTTRRYVFSASHRLHSDRFTEEENRDVFGKCNNPYGHGHDYELFVTARGPVDAQTGRAVDPKRLDELVYEQVLSALDHKYLNVDVPAFAEAIPTTENLAFEIARMLQSHWREAFPGEWPVLEKLRIRETDRNIFELSLTS